MSTSTARSATDLDRLRRRSLGTLVGGVALGSTGHIAALTVATIVAGDMTGSVQLAGTPAAAVVFGAALGATSLSFLMSQRGRRLGLSLGYLVGVAGAVVAVAAIVAGSLPLLLLGSLLIGFGNSSNQLSRYAAADLYPADRRATALGTVVWAATVGAVIGPNLVGPSGDVAMGYWDDTDIPFYYGLGRTFPLCDRFFCSGCRPTRAHISSPSSLSAWRRSSRSSGCDRTRTTWPTTRRRPNRAMRRRRRWPRSSVVRRC